MPCADDNGRTQETTAHERRHNLARYGIDATDAGLARAVACELGRLVTSTPRLSDLLGDTALKWLANHRVEDALAIQAAREAMKG